MLSKMFFKKRTKSRSMITGMLAAFCFVAAAVYFYEIPMIDLGNVMVMTVFVLILIVLASILFVAFLKLITCLFNRKQ